MPLPPRFALWREIRVITRASAGGGYGQNVRHSVGQTFAVVAAADGLVVVAPMVQRPISAICSSGFRMALHQL